MKILLASVAVFALASVSLASPFARLILNSPPGDWVGQGRNWDTYYDETTEGDFDAKVIRETNNQPSMIEFAFGWPIATPYNTLASASFGTDGLSIPLAPGYYPNVRRASFAPAGYAGLDIAWQNRGCNQLDGWIQINRFEYTGTSGNFTITEFDAEFGQNCEFFMPTMTGRLTYSSVPEPGTLAAVGLGIAALVRRRRRSR